MNIINSLPGSWWPFCFLKESCWNSFLFKVWRGKNQQSVKFMSSNLWICKVKMELYLEIKNGVFLVWSVKSVGLQNLHVFKISRKYCQFWLAENRCGQLSNVPVFLLESYVYMISISDKNSKGAPIILHIKIKSWS